MNRLATRLIAVLAMVFSFVVVAPAAQATFSGKNGKIVGQVSYRTDLSGDVHQRCAILTRPLPRWPLAWPIRSGR
jgi:hypothetical protein